MLLRNEDMRRRYEIAAATKARKYELVRDHRAVRGSFRGNHPGSVDFEHGFSRGGGGKRLNMAEELKGQGDLRIVFAAKPAGFHHVGFVVTSIDKTGCSFANSLGAEWNGEIIHDPLQGARVTFLRCGGPGAPAVELVEPAGEKSPLHKFLSRGGGLHHVCYEVDSLEAQLKQSRAAGCLIVKEPLPAVAFGGRRIAWVYTPEKLLVEYLQRQ